jgi:hypothetical protein
VSIGVRIFSAAFLEDNVSHLSIKEIFLDGMTSTYVRTFMCCIADSVSYVELHPEFR